MVAWRCPKGSRGLWRDWGNPSHTDYLYDQSVRDHCPLWSRNFLLCVVQYNRQRASFRSLSQSVGGDGKRIQRNRGRPRDHPGIQIDWPLLRLTSSHGYALFRSHSFCRGINSACRHGVDIAARPKYGGHQTRTSAANLKSANAPAPEYNRASLQCSFGRNV